MRTAKAHPTQKRRGPKPRGLVKKTIVMSKTREAAIQRAVAEGRARSESGYVEEALEAFETLASYDDLLAKWRHEVGPATKGEKAWAADVVKRAAGGKERRAG